MATLTAIRDGIATRLATVSGLEVHATVPGTINPPAVVIFPAPGAFANYTTSAGTRETDDWSFTVRLLVQRGDEAAAQGALDPYIDPSGSVSISAAIDGDPTLGGVVDDCDLVDARNYGVFEYNGNPYFGCEFSLRVMA